MPINHRPNDAVLTICQNNKEKLVTISEINDAAKGLIGFEPSEVVSRPLSNILPPRIAELLTEYIDFENDSNDVGSVLSKVQSFSIVGKNGQEKSYRTKISRTESTGSSAFFSLVLQDAIGARKNDAVRQIIKENFKGHESLDTQTDLPNRASLVKDIELMKHHANSSDMLSCFAVLQIDGYNKLLSKNGNSVCNEIVKFVASTASRCLRPDDVVGSVGDGRIGVLLVDITKDSERLVLNRLRWQVASNPFVDEDKKSISLSASISFFAISALNSDKKVLERCEVALDGLDAGALNILVDATV
jgi:diguanylate cyclase (GGDEF)-like protein